MSNEHQPQDSLVVQRLRRKLESRNKRIQGLERKIVQLESKLATKDVEEKRLPIELRRIVQDALCNVRLVPVVGLRSNDRIVEVVSKEKE